MAKRTKLQKKSDNKGKNKAQKKVMGPSTNPDRKVSEKSGGANSFFRSKSKIKLLNVYNEKPD